VVFSDGKKRELFKNGTTEDKIKSLLDRKYVNLREKMLDINQKVFPLTVKGTHVYLTGMYNIVADSRM
jgi:hypothetical protein